jgi:lipoprotein NlpI
MSRFVAGLFAVGILLAQGASEAQTQDSKKKTETHPLTKEERGKMRADFDQQIATMTEKLKADQKQVGFYSRRADAYFFIGEFDKSLADYEEMVELDEAMGPSHWRRGIARFYANKFKEAAHQFEIYHSFDDVDRENGIWRFFSQYKAYGKKKAQAGLLKYKKDDREPFPSVYKLFSGDLKGEAILKSIADADISDADREKRRFYANLYVGLNYALEGKPKLAVPYLRDSTANKWGPTAGYGPNYMWHVGRLHYEILTKQLSTKQLSTKKKSQNKDAAKTDASK